MMQRALLAVALVGPAVAVFLYTTLVSPLDGMLVSVVAALPVVLWVALRSARQAARR